MTPDAIRSARTEAGLSQAAAAVLLDRPVLAIKRWEAGTSPMEPAIWALYRARLAVVAGDNRRAISVLRETVPSS